MDKPPYGYRDPKKAALFSQPSDDPSIVPDRISPKVEGYFRIPAIWIEQSVEHLSGRFERLTAHHDTIVQMNLSCGIEVRALRDGTFLFDFSKFSLAPTVIIPGYQIPSSSIGHRIPPDHTKNEELAETYALIRSQILNVHQACLTTAESVLKRRSATMGFPVTSWNTNKLISLDDIPQYFNDSEDVHSIARNFLNNRLGPHNFSEVPRRILEKDVVEKSLLLLDNILSKMDIKLIRIVESIYLSESRRSERRLGEAIMLAWNSCEQLISILWKNYLRSADDRENNKHVINKERFKKLVGRDYTASVRIEFLHLLGIIDKDQYRKIEIARKARNKWAHEMKDAKDSEIHISIRAAESILLTHLHIHIFVNTSHRGGVAQWPVWMMNQQG